MATDGLLSYVTFLYDDIQYTESSRAEARITLFNEFGSFDQRSVTLPGSETEDIRNLTTTSNVGVPGMWIYRVDDSSNIIHPLAPM